MKNENILIGDWIFQNRKIKGLTQHYLARELNLTKGTVSGWEKHRFVPKLLSMLKLTAIFNTPLPSQFEMENIGLEIKKYTEIKFMDTFLNPTTQMLIVEEKLKECFVWVSNDDAMNSILKGDLLIISPISCPKPADYVLAKCKDFLYLRKFRLLDPLNSNKFELVSENNQYPIISSSKHFAKIVGIVKEIRRTL